MNQVIAKGDYNEWINDTLWLPSLTETGYYGYDGDNSNTGVSLWGIPVSVAGNAVRASSISNGCWLRSGSATNASGARGLGSGGDSSYAITTTSSGVRPALHLNLTEAALYAAGESLDNPTDVTTTYDGTAQNVKSLYDTKNWYNATWYEHSGNYVAVACYAASDASLSTPLTTVTDAGDYWVKVDLATWAADVDTQVANEFSGSNVTGTRLTTAQTSRRPRFKGTASSDGPTESAACSAR